jgi:uncharacterized protein (DUF1697 family)
VLRGWPSRVPSTREEPLSVFGRSACGTVGPGTVGWSVVLKMHIALLRGVNVGGHKKVAMADLCGLLTQLGLEEARSLLQSGNLVFRSAARTGAQLELLLGAAAKKRLALDTEFFVRTVEEWRAIIAGNPFHAEAKRDAGHLIVLFLKDDPGAARVEALRAAITGPEVVRANGRQAYVVYPIGIGRSRLTDALIEKKLGTRATGRNWNTVLKLGILAGT